MEKLLNIQAKLKAPKGNYNSFGKYKYRSCEDILEAVKPLLAEEKCVLTLTDEIVVIGDRYYVKATATIAEYASELLVADMNGTGSIKVTPNSISVSAYAREEETKKGMDGSQVTGTASSYARKYALNGLFLIDDTKDADTDEYAVTTQKRVSTVKEAVELATDLEKKTFMDLCGVLGVDYKDILKQVGVKDKMTKQQHGKALIILRDIENAQKGQK